MSLLTTLDHGGRPGALTNRETRRRSLNTNTLDEKPGSLKSITIIVLVPVKSGSAVRTAEKDTRVREQERYHARPHRHGPSIRGPESNYGATCRRSSPERPLMGRCRRTSASGERARPRIIHVGNRQMSEAAERIRKEAWRRHSREGLLRDMKSQGAGAVMPDDLTTG
ncbi:hypothetical protein ANOM_005758 [Aspergillus nomiae NRRL 13137]|uniref:Uncharacterized protein n=1 Tax=Aspergillus nomiae NRRL (strain ATCC 15546 / NRRL 13137 / CBS 260.88 / M93) TaxID=1509407 RepID=A0A0L1J279_ASPN3|nr:uncharacterized protein ANOM_005758 [Aspergillus nomiae NRRL 13137]KNG85508.1 hypothetical protein ANOM_005758 [Aspergillus nomiae NRRL 13137]